MSIELAELPLHDLAPGGRRRQRFEEIHGPDWLSLGIQRWLRLLDPGGPWPTVVLGALAGDDLHGAIVGVWAARPIERFDDLLEGAEPGGRRGADRPEGGVWHFIAVTADRARPDLKVGRPLLGAALAFVAARAGLAEARTLSPAAGLAEALAALGASPGDRPAMLRILHRLARPDGVGYLPILGLHPANGATLEKVLFDSRRDEVRSAGVTLRFRYDLAAAARQTQAERYRAWVEARRVAAAEGRAPAAGWRELVWAPDCGDAQIFEELSAGQARD